MERLNMCKEFSEKTGTDETTSYSEIQMGG
jgi:hypothetical protein